MALMDGQPKEPNHLPTMSRRDALVAGVIVFADGMVASVPKSALAAMEPSTQDSFMRMSTLLINHQLRPEIGVRVAETAAGQYKDLPGMLDAIIAIAERKHAAVVEDFFPDVPEGPLKETALAIISAWYLGVVNDAPDAEVVAFEYALMYKPTSDVMTIPSYAISGPNGWTSNAPPLSDMPEF